MYGDDFIVRLVDIGVLVEDYSSEWASPTI
jgi:hypothetical protein